MVGNPTSAHEADYASAISDPSKFMITAILVYEHPQASSLIEALQPDNTPEIRMKLIGKKVLVVARGNSLRTVVASCDDLFANLQIAQEILCDSEESKGF